MFCTHCMEDVKPMASLEIDAMETLAGLVCPNCREEFLDGINTCRVCGFVGSEVHSRVSRFAKPDHATRQDLDKLRLCDLCACVGSLCSGADGHASVSQLTQRELVHLLRATAEKISPQRLIAKIAKIANSDQGLFANRE